LTFYQLRVSAKGEVEQFKDPKALQEATLANNVRVLAVDRGRGPYRILYVSGRPNWEYKFLRRALADDDQVDLVGLIRIAKREPKFEFRGRAGESSNPLFRGFGNQSQEEIERYDQPVLIRLNTRDEVELRGGFPKTAEDLFGYHALIVDDLEAEFFKPDQMSLLQNLFPNAAAASSCSVAPSRFTRAVPSDPRGRHASRLSGSMAMEAARDLKLT
jgi:hypothetical protein